VLLRGNVRLTAYNEELGTEKALVTSDRGRLNTSTNELFAEGNAVLLIRADGRRIESYELYYIPDEDLIRSDSATVMYSEDGIMEGTSFTSDLNFDNVVILNGRTRGGAVRF
jgi:LPS export ABC transporter protein LptC